MRRLFPVLFCVLLLVPAATAQADPAPTGSLSTTVRDRDGKPLVGVWLTLQPSGRVTMTDEKGAAKFTGLPPGPYTVSLALSGYHSAAFPVALGASPDNRLSVTLEKSGVTSVLTHDAAGDAFTGPLVPRPTPPPPEYLATPPVPPGSGPAWRTAQETVLREAVFRYLFSAHYLSPVPPPRFRVYYLSVQGFPWGQGAQASRDPDAALLRRFRGNSPPVRAVSALPASSKDWDNQFRHHWIIYRVSSFQWTSDTCVVIDAGSAQSGYLSSDSFSLICTLRNGWWEITGIGEKSV